MRKVSEPYQKGSDQGYWLRWRDPITKKPVTSRFPTKKLAEHFRHIKYQQLNSDVFQSAIAYPWEMAKKEFLQRYDLTLKKRTKEEAEDFLDRLENFCMITSTEQISQPLLLGYLKHRKKTISNAYTLNNDVRLFKTLTKWLAKNRYCLAEMEYPRFKTPPPRITALTDTQIKSLLAACPSRQWQLRIITGLTTGLRKTDLYKLPRAAVDLAETGVDTVETKTQKRKLACLPDALVAALKVYDKSLPAHRHYFFRVYNQQWLDKQFRAFRPVKNITLQSLRKTYATRIESTSFSAAALNHSTPDITRRFYSDMDYIRYVRVNQLPVAEWLAVPCKKTADKAALSAVRRRKDIM
jgi:integrase